MASEPIRLALAVAATLALAAQAARAQEPADTAPGPTPTPPPTVEEPAVTPSQPAPTPTAPPATTPTAPPATTPTAPPATTPTAAAASEQKPQLPYTGSWVGIEFGMIRAGDERNVFNEGLGRALVLSLYRWELRLFEAYDLDDPIDAYDGYNSEARMALTSVARRLSLLRLGPVRASGLLGVAWLRRPSMRYDENALVSFTDFEARNQHGLGAVLGAGVTLELGRLLVINADVRAYPTRWDSITGQRAVLMDGMAVVETIDESPTGTPTTASVALGMRF